MAAVVPWLGQGYFMITDSVPRGRLEVIAAYVAGTNWPSASVVTIGAIDKCDTVHMSRELAEGVQETGD